jgi:hypothetical protein
VIAIPRFLLDNFLHIKAYWIQIGVKPAQIAPSSALTTSSERWSTRRSRTPRSHDGPGPAWT